MTPETTEVTVPETQTTLPALADQMKDLGISAQDLVIPKLLLMQNTSEYVGDEVAKLGDIVNSQTIEVLGGFERPLSIVPLKLYKTWRVYNMDSGNPEFLRQEPVTAQNEKLPWEDVEEVDSKQVAIRRDMCMNFFILLTTEVQEGTAFPLVVSFKRTSMQAGRQLATHLFKMACLGRPPFSQAVPLKVTKQKKETNTYAAFEMGKGVALTTEQVALARSWLDRLATITYKVDEVDEETVEAPAAATAPIVVGEAPAMKF